MATKTKGKTVSKSKAGGTAKKAGAAKARGGKTKGASASAMKSGSSRSMMGKGKGTTGSKPGSKGKTKTMTASKTPAKKGTGRKPNAQFMKPMQIKEPLTRIVGTEPLPRTEVTKRVWNYIKEHKLQDQVNRRQINADENLRELFGRDNVTMFEMTAIVNKYLGD